MRLAAALCAVLTAVCAVDPAAATIYRCQKNGHLTFSDTRCAVSPSEAAAARPVPTPEAPPAQPAAAAAATAVATTPASPSPALTPAAAPAPAASAVQGPAAATSAAALPATQIITLPNGKAQLRLTDTFRYLDAPAAQKVIVQAWGNPPDSVGDVLGMIVPAGLDPAGEDGWGAVVTYSDEGYVSDKDADQIDYTELLQQMQAAEEEENEARARQGYAPLHLAGWAEPPHYRRASHRLYWAQDLESTGHHTLNYAVRVLGRDGVLELNAVANTEQIGEIKRRMEQVVGFAEFTEGHRYEDYQAGVDKTAAYGLAALVAGGVAAKKGLLAGLLLMLVKGWKLLAVGLVALGGILRKVFGGRARADT